MTVVPGALTKIDTTVDFTNYTTYVVSADDDGNDRVLHNKTQVVMGQFQGITTTLYRDNPVLRYWFLDGSEASAYTVVSGTGPDVMTHLLDFAYDGQSDQYYMVGLTTISGSPTTPGLRVFTTDLSGVYTSTFIQELDADLTWNSDIDTTYASYVNGEVMITADNVATPNLYLKVGSALYKFSTGSSYNHVDQAEASGVIASGTAQGYVNSLNWVGYSGQDFITYLQYDNILNKVYIKRINDTTLAQDSEQVLTDISDFDTDFFDAGNYKLFFNQIDFNTCYYLGVDGSLYEYNVDELLAAFIAVNVDDAIMPAGTGAQTNVTAEVINAYGDALTGKSVGFAVTAGLGSITGGTPVVTSGGGVATTVFQVGNSTGLATITATVTES